VNLINDDKANKINIAGTGTLASDDIPFFCCGDESGNGQPFPVQGPSLGQCKQS